jgi:hypothetical protein
MSDLFQGQTMTEMYRFISAGTAHTFTFNFQPDKVVFNNLADWTGTAGGIPISTWFRNETAAGTAKQQVVIDSAAVGATFNFVNAAANGFTVADTAGGQATMHATISAVTQADPCVVTHSAYAFQTNQIVRITDLGADMPVPHGMNQLNNNRYRIVVLTPTTFSLKDPVSGEPINSTAYTAYVSGGRITLETAVISLNNPQVSPYSDANPYNPNPFKYNPITYQLTAGTAVMGGDGERFVIEVYKFGQVTNLGDLLV